jgi:hypothetical protein
MCRTFGKPTEQLPIDEDDNYADVRIDPGDSTAGILAFYSRTQAAADQVIGGVDLVEVGAHDVRRYDLAAVGRDPHS